MKTVIGIFFGLLIQFRLGIRNSGKKEEQSPDQGITCYKDVIGNLLGFEHQNFKKFLKDSEMHCERMLNDGKFGLESAPQNKSDKENIAFEEFLLGISCT